MARPIFFDLGDTLEAGGALRPGALETLIALSSLVDGGGERVPLALISNYTMPGDPSEIPAIRAEYERIIDDLGLRRFFEPLAERVTLSTEVGAPKPDPRIFRAAIDKIEPGLGLHHAIFITEHAGHVEAARRLGISALHLRAPGGEKGDVDDLPGLVPVVRRLVAYDPCGKHGAQAMGRTVSTLNRSKMVDPEIAKLVQQVDTGRMLAAIGEMVGFVTRWSFAPQITEVTDWVHRRLLAAGCDPMRTRFQEFTLPGAAVQCNVLARLGPEVGGIVLVCAHYDSLAEQPGTAAPGADDDASGVAAVLEIARLLAAVTLHRQVLLAVFGGEEQGLFGSAACAEVAAREGWPIEVVINLDMIGFNSRESPTVVVEYDQGNRNPSNDAAAKAFGLVMAQAAADFTGLAVEHTDIWNSDYMPFEARGFACIGAFEGGKNPHYHRSTDTLDRIDGEYLTEVVRMVLATTVLLARQA